MDDIRIPCIVWFHGDPPPDLSGYSDPIRIPFTLRTRAEEPSDLSKDYHPVASDSFAEAQSGLPLRFKESPAIVHLPIEQFRTDASNPREPEPELPSRAHASPGGPGSSRYIPHARGSFRPVMPHRPPTGPYYDYRAPDGRRYRWFANGNMVPGADVEDRQLNIVDPSPLYGNPQERGDDGLNAARLGALGMAGAVLGTTCVVAEPCGIIGALGGAAIAGIAAAIILDNQQQNGSPSTAGQPEPSDGTSIDDLVGNSSPGRATKGPTDQYDRPGGFDDAQGDFNSLNPSNVRPAANNPDVQIGTLADGRTVTVRPTSSDGRPTSELYNPTTGRSIKIRYGN